MATFIGVVMCGGVCLLIQCLILNEHLCCSGHVWLGVSPGSDTKNASRVGCRLDYVLNIC